LTAADSLFPTRNAAIEPFTVKATGTPCPAGSFKATYDVINGLSIVYDQFPAPNDNSYGVNAVGWGTRGHKFSDLVGSDHAGFQLFSPAGAVVLSFNVDTITADATAPSGYRSLGVLGGEGKMIVPAPGVGAADGIIGTHSISKNLNNINIPGLFNPVTHAQLIGTAGAGAVNVLVDSPKTLNQVDDYTLTPDSLAAGFGNWDFHNTFFVSISQARLASLGFDSANWVFADYGKCPAGKWCISPNDDQLHNSPAKPCPCPTGTTDPTPNITVDSTTTPGKTIITYEQSLAVNDNSYGLGTDASWGTKTHTFKDLLGSDKLQVVVADKYNFVLDYISADVSRPSGYGSLGPFGGDGSMTLQQGAGSVSNWSTSQDENMNVNCAPPSGPWTTDSPSSPLAPQCPAWDFVNRYTVTVNGTFSASDVTFPLVHNSPSKPSTCPTTPPPGSACNITVVKKEFKGRTVKITLKNNGTIAANLASLNLTWTSGAGKLKKVSLGRDVLYDKPDLNPPSANLPFATSKKTRIDKGHQEVLTIEFANNVTASNVTKAIAKFVNCPDEVKLLP